MAKNQISPVPTTVIKLITAVLKPSATEGEYISNARGVYTSILGLAGSTFPPAVLSVTMAQFKADIDDLDNKEAGLHTKPPTHTVAERNAAKLVVGADQTLLLADVQKIARRTPANAISIVESAGFAVKRKTPPSKSAGPKNTKVSGTVVITAPEPGFHEWAQLAADGVTWIYLRASRGHKKTVAGLTVGQHITFKSAPVLSDKEGEGAWTVYTPITVT